IYESEFGTAGGQPYAALIGDFEFSSHPDDVSLLTKMSNVAAAGFCPFISAASPGMFGFDSFTELSKPRDLEKIFDSAEYIQWRQRPSALASRRPHLEWSASTAVRRFPRRATWNGSSALPSTSSGAASATAKTRASSRWPCPGCWLACATARPPSRWRPSTAK